MAGDRLPGCNHPNGWQLRLRDGPRLYKYCWGCIIKKTGIQEIYAKPLKEKKDKAPEASDGEPTTEEILADIEKPETTSEEEKKADE